MRASMCLALVLLAASSARAGDWPKVFLRVDGTNHTMVALYANGTAAFSKRTSGERPPGFISAATRANWRWCDSDEGAAAGQKCLHLYISGISNAQSFDVRMDYWYEDLKITEFDKTGIVEVLRLVRGASK